ncbi:hypothetical protein S83_063819 [Arachis hypogaea]
MLECDVPSNPQMKEVFTFSAISSNSAALPTSAAKHRLLPFSAIISNNLFPVGFFNNLALSKNDNFSLALVVKLATF